MKYRWLKWNDDRWLSTQGAVLHYDKIEHALTSAVLALIATFLMPLLAGCLLVLFIGALWEIKDGYMHCEVYGWWGGEGFSWKDLIADSIGIIIVFILKF